MNLRRRRILAGLLILILVTAVTYPFRRSVAYFVLFHLGRSEPCSWADISRNVNQRDNDARRQALFEAACRKLRADPGGCELWDTPSGQVWIPGGSDSTVVQLFSQVDSQPYELSPCDLRPGDIVLDCGAHVGLFTRRALSAGAKLVVAVEPARRSLECLRRNLAAEIDAGRVVVCPKGVWEKEGLLSFREGSGASLSSRIVLEPLESAGLGEIPVTTIDTLVSEFRIERVDFIKLHVEGAEVQALEGARATLAKFHPRIAVAANHHENDAERIPSVIRAAWPDCRLACNGCFVDRIRLAIRPQVLLFFE